MTFAKRLQAFMAEITAKREAYDAIDMTRAFLVQLAACAAVASVKSGENLELVIDAICVNLRKTARQCRAIELKRLC